MTAAESSVMGLGVLLTTTLRIHCSHLHHIKLSKTKDRFLLPVSTRGACTHITLSS